MNKSKFWKKILTLSTFIALSVPAATGSAISVIVNSAEESLTSQAQQLQEQTEQPIKEKDRFQQPQQNLTSSLGQQTFLIKSLAIHISTRLLLVTVKSTIGLALRVVQLLGILIKMQ